MILNLQGYPIIGFVDGKFMKYNLTSKD